VGFHRVPGLVISRYLRKGGIPLRFKICHPERSAAESKDLRFPLLAAQKMLSSPFLVKDLGKIFKISSLDPKEIWQVNSLNSLK
jgi:hypothetical protein